MNPQLEALKKHLDSDEGKASMKRFVQKMVNRQVVRQRWVEKIHTYYGDNIDTLTEKLMDKYYSKELHVFLVNRLDQPRFSFALNVFFLGQ